MAHFGSNRCDKCWDNPCTCAGWTPLTNVYFDKWYNLDCFYNNLKAEVKKLKKDRGWNKVEEDLFQKVRVLFKHIEDFDNKD